MMVKDYNEKLALILGELARIGVESDTLKDYAAPVAAGKCETLRKQPVDLPEGDRGGFVTTRHQQRDWYCTNRPIIEAPVVLPPILEQKR